MALLNCPKCNKQISDTANSCPHCGYKPQLQPNTKKNPNKKKIIITIIIIVAIIVIGFISVLAYLNIQKSKYNAEISSILNEIQNVDSEADAIINTTTSFNVEFVYNNIRGFSDDYIQFYNKCSEYPELSQIKSDIENIIYICNKSSTSDPNQMFDMLEEFVIEKSTLELDIEYFDDYK